MARRFDRSGGTIGFIAFGLLAMIGGLMPLLSSDPHGVWAPSEIAGLAVVLTGVVLVLVGVVAQVVEVECSNV